MKTSAIIIRILAIVLFVSMVIINVVNYEMSSIEMTESWEELEEDIEEHEDECYERNCYECDSLEEREESLARRSTQLTLSLVQSILLYLIFCGILYSIGEVIAAMRRSKEPPYLPPSMPEPVPVQKPTYVACPNCGKAQQPGNRYCAVCGTSIPN